MKSINEIEMKSKYRREFIMFSTAAEINQIKKIVNSYLSGNVTKTARVGSQLKTKPDQFNSYCVSCNTRDIFKFSV